MQLVQFLMGFLLLEKVLQDLKTYIYLVDSTLVELGQQIILMIMKKALGRLH